MDLKKVLTLHSKYLLGSADGVSANLRGADLSYADLSGANLRGANLHDADLSYANLHGANLRGADLSYADLRGTDLHDADLSYANLHGANLRDADLRGANLRDAGLSYADLSSARLPHFQICPEEGSFIAYKKTTLGVIRILIPEDAERTNSLVGRKCRASKVLILDGEGCGGTGTHYTQVTYKKGETIVAARFDGDIRTECTNGIHFFMTKQEAEEWY